MNDALIALIKAFTLTAREVLRKEAGRQLENLYGWLPDGGFADTRHYPAILELDEARQTRRRLEQYAADEKAAGVGGENARRKLIRETAFTWLNRLVAFHLMEERKLLKQTIAGLEKSGGFICWLAEYADNNARSMYQQGRLPHNALGEGPCEAAYRQFLLWQCGELARDVSLLFDPMTLPSALCPGPDVLKQLVDEMKAEGLIDAWRPGNEETIGWVYQAFNEDELQAAFAGAREQGKKFKAEDIPAVTQLFTARWVVRFLIENTVGRLWIEMHPDSRLKNSLAYFVPRLHAFWPGCLRHLCGDVSGRVGARGAGRLA